MNEIIEISKKIEQNLLIGNLTKGIPLSVVICHCIVDGVTNKNIQIWPLLFNANNNTYYNYSENLFAESKNLKDAYEELLNMCNGIYANEKYQVIDDTLFKVSLEEILSK